MADIIMFHHVLGLTDGVREFAARLGDGGHAVYTPDLYDGRVGATLEEGFAIKGEIGDGELDRRVDDVLAELPNDLVYAGMSLGVMYAQKLTQTRSGAVGALLYEACVPITGDWAFGPWPDGVPVQIHGMDDDEFFAHEGDVDAARDLVAAIGAGLGAVYTYPGSQHLFLDNTLESYDAAATELVLERSRSLVERIG